MAQALFLRIGDGGLTDDQVSTLRTSGVAFYPFRANGRPGITLDDVDQEAAQSALGMNIIQAARTDYEGVVECILEAVPTLNRVRIPVAAPMDDPAADRTFQVEQNPGRRPVPTIGGMPAMREPQDRGLVIDPYSIIQHNRIEPDEFIMDERITRLRPVPAAGTALPPDTVVDTPITPAVIPEPVTSELSHTVTVGQWNDDYFGKSQAYAYIAREVLLPAIKRNIKINYRESTARIKATTGSNRTLSLHLGEGTCKDGFQKTDRLIFGESVGARYLYKPEGPGRVLVNSDNLEFAQIEDNDIWVLFLIGATDSQVELRCFRKTLEAIVDELSLTDEQREELRVSRETAKQKKKKEDYVASCRSRIDKIINVTKSQIGIAETDIRLYGQGLTRKIRSLNGLRQKLPQLEESRDKNTDKYANEFDKLFKVRGVRDIEVEGDVLNVFTDVIYCVDDRTGKRHEIGKFRVEINLGPNSGIKFLNLDRVVRGINDQCHHPHVFRSDGTACLGTAAEIFPTLLANYEVAAIISVAIQFLESANTQDRAGAYISNWPLAKDDEAGTIDTVVSPPLTASAPTTMTIEEEPTIYYDDDE